MTKVLLVEDHTAVREILLKQLEMMNFFVVTAENGKKGVERAIAEKPDLILMNSIMPEMDGWEATRLLRSNHETKAIPILAITALSRSSHLSAWIDAGCNDYLVKPFALGELQRKIQALIRKQ